ncbi:beta-lactamase family protein [Acetobacter sacchari]|uniref:Beta-lactamase family protein n=1 Tax=Acetobacter sacchari TaxID=2661687 RepID=A0ABS3LSG4_9PROT|nr:beta-lactamase family protein [Acetobacter sacchari]
MAHQVHVDVDKLDGLLAPFDSTSAPGFAVGVGLKGRPVYRRGVGLASVETSTALSPSIRMRIGSTSKHFCVLALMLLKEDGLLSLDDSPRRVLPELPAWADDMTIRQLMAHTSGMRDSLDILMLSAPPSAPIAADEQFKMLCQTKSVNFLPGNGWSYNNGGYVLLSMIIERLSGAPLGEFLRERIFLPVGMVDTMLRPLDTDLVPNSATLHVPDLSGGWRRGVMGAPVGGEGGIVSTVDDMLRWLAHMSTPRVGSAESWAEMRTPAASHGYGLGLMMGTYRGLSTVHHAGGVIGGSCQMLKVVDCDLDVIVISNGRNALDLYNLVDAIIDSCVADLPVIQQDTVGAVATGTYYSKNSGRVLKISENNGNPFMMINGMTLPAKRDRSGAYSVSIMPTDIRVMPDGPDFETLNAIEFERTDRLERVHPPASHSEKKELFGEYKSEISELFAFINGNVMRVSGVNGSQDYTLEQIGSDIWMATTQSFFPMLITLEVSESGILMSSGRTARLHFKRQ